MYALFATLGCIEAVAQRFAALCSQCRTCRRARVGAIAAEEGFALNFRKTRCMGSATRQTVTGLVVNRFANIPRAEYDEIKAILHNCAAHGAATQNRAGVADFRAHLQGRVAHVVAVHPTRGVRLQRLFESIVWAG